MGIIIAITTMGKKAKGSSSDQQLLQALLREIRLEAGLRQVDLANRLGQAQSFVSKYESGERRLDILELKRICECTGVEMVDFVRRFVKLSGKD